ncbi:CaiB/BaiF CoA transferase family protein [Hyphococcus sp.]|uniref:CaiB/BaiF CoA transferase family protein n=1 Tax=Hyphococcus sp. TaxID=2038636 RepID=UPI003CCBD1F6
MTGPLAGVRIIEFTGIGPGPFCGMMLADHGAEVIRIDRPGGFMLPGDPLARSRKSIAIDTKKPEGAALAREIVKTADGLIEGYRPGVMERLGLGPQILHKDNPKLVYGRMTGWGQNGPYASAAGHDINYIALSGALHGCGRKNDKPTPPVNYLGDFGGGAMMLAFGMVSAILAVKNGAKGQVIDCAMTDGSALLTAMTYGLKAAGQWRDKRGVNLLDTGAHFYDTYETKDGKWISIGALEPQFYALLREKLNLAEDKAFDAQLDQSKWDLLKQKLTEIFKTQTRDDWCALLENTDVCFAPVLSMEEAPLHPHNVSRGAFITVDGVTQPGPAPRYSDSKNDHPTPAPDVGADAVEILSMIGRREDEDKLRQAGVII